MKTTCAENELGEASVSMSKTQSNNYFQVPIKPFPTRAILFYWAVQIVLGLLLSIFNMEGIPWFKKALLPLENLFPTFRTGFVQSSSPVASKIYLAIWWLIILPWGLMFSYKWTEGFKPHPNGLNMSYTTLLGLLGTALLTALMLGALLSFYDYSYYWMVDKQNSPSRGDVVPALMTNGPLTLSIWVAVSSFVFVISLIIIFCITRIFIKRFFGKPSDVMTMQR